MRQRRHDLDLALGPETRDVPEPVPKKHREVTPCVDLSPAIPARVEEFPVTGVHLRRAAGYVNILYPASRREPDAILHGLESPPVPSPPPPPDKKQGGTRALP